jgi:hypothetical protein
MLDNSIGGRKRRAAVATPDVLGTLRFNGNLSHWKPSPRPSLAAHAGRQARRDRPIVDQVIDPYRNAFLSTRNRASSGDKPMTCLSTR